MGVLLPLLMAVQVLLGGLLLLACMRRGVGTASSSWRSLHGADGGAPAACCLLLLLLLLKLLPLLVVVVLLQLMRLRWCACSVGSWSTA